MCVIKQILYLNKFRYKFHVKLWNFRIRTKFWNFISQCLQLFTSKSQKMESKNESKKSKKDY